MIAVRRADDHRGELHADRPRALPGARVRISGRASGASSASISRACLSAMTPNTIGRRSGCVSDRYDASAFAPAGLCAPSTRIDRSPRATTIQAAGPARVAKSRLDRLAAVARGRPGSRSRISVATTALSTWCRPRRPRTTGPYCGRLAPRYGVGGTCAIHAVGAPSVRSGRPPPSHLDVGGRARNHGAPLGRRHRRNHALTPRRSSPRRPRGRRA